MPPTSGILTYNDIDALRTRINLDLLKLPVPDSTLARQFCWYREAEGKPVGVVDVFPARWPSRREQTRTFFEDEGGRLPQFVELEVTHLKRSPEPEVRDEGMLVTDLYGMLNEDLPEFVQEGALEYDLEFARLLGEGTGRICRYDKKNFYATDHLVNPHDPSLGTFRNYRAGLTLNRAGILQGLHDMAQVKGPTGKLGYWRGPVYLWTSTVAQEHVARTEVFGTFVPNGAGTATQSNPLPEMSLVQGVIRIDQMADYNSGKGWGLLRVMSDKFRPYILSMAMKPYTFIEGLSPNDHSRVTRNKVKYGYRAHWGAGEGFPQLGWYAQEP